MWATTLLSLDADGGPSAWRQSQGFAQVNITSRQLRAFILTARHESFSRAADEMFITQSGISIMVRELESQLGFRLFDRTTRKVRLTDLGACFLPTANRCLCELEAAVLRIRRSSDVAESSRST
jgi:DNA-binding transcriptional LysR family regulator